MPAGDSSNPIPAARPSRGESSIGKIEIAVGALFTLAVVWIHVNFPIHAGGLWCDEANTVGVATLPTLGDVWRSLEFDSFPIVWPMVIRLCHSLGLASDSAFRGLGLFAGLSEIGALWILTRTFRTGAPLLSLTLFALCPAAIIFGDSLRAHGSGIATAYLAYALTWRFVEAGNWRSWISAALASVLTVQVSYYSSLVVLAAGVAGSVVCLRRKRFNIAGLALASGALAGLSLLPYIPVFRRASDWNVLIQIPEYKFTDFCDHLSQTLAIAGPVIVWLWLALIVVAGVLAIGALISLPDWKVPERNQDVILFNLTALAIGIPAYFGFLKMLHYATEDWYYIALLASVATGIDAILGAACFTVPTRIVRLGITALLFPILAIGAFDASSYRMTNVDLVAAKLQTLASKKDLIVVDPWFNGVEYARYHQSSAPWTTVPPIEFHRFQRYDLIKSLMENPDQADLLHPLLERMRETLQSGGKIYMAGDIHYLPQGAHPTLLPPAPQGVGGWNWAYYRDNWSYQVAYFIQFHAVTATMVRPNAKASEKIFENLPLTAIAGWRD